MNKALEWSIKNEIGFSEDDLSANRDGQLRDSQQQKLVAKRQGSLVLAVLGLIIAAGVFVRVVFDNGFKSSDKLSIVLLTCLALVVALLYLWLKWSQYVSDLDRGIAFASEGPLELITYHNRGNNIYRLRVNRASFGLDKHLFDLLTAAAKKHEYCAVYYTPRSKILLSFEVLDNRKHYKK